MHDENLCKSLNICEIHLGLTLLSLKFLESISPLGSDLSFTGNSIVLEATLKESSLPYVCKEYNNSINGGSGTHSRPNCICHKKYSLAQFSSCKVST